jgi:hypothetical protein
MHKFRWLEFSICLKYTDANESNNTHKNSQGGMKLKNISKVLNYTSSTALVM